MSYIDLALLTMLSASTTLRKEMPENLFGHFQSYDHISRLIHPKFVPITTRSSGSKIYQTFSAYSHHGNSSELNFDVVDRAGKKHQAADALHRLPTMGQMQRHSKTAFRL